MEITKEVLETIQRVVALHSPRYRIPGYQPEDVEQEAYIMCLEAIKVWDEVKGPLENFLNKHLFFKLKTFVRDKTLADSIFKDRKKGIMCPLDISLLNADEENALIAKDDVLETVQNDEILRKIDEYLPVALRRDYLKMKAGIKVNKGRAKKIRLFILSLLKELVGDIEDE